MTADRSINRPGYLLGGREAGVVGPSRRRFLPAGDTIAPYSDRKAERFDDALLDLDTIVAIQRMAAIDGMSRDQILHALGPQGVRMEQISRALDSKDEHSPKPRRQEYAGVGYAKVKARFR